MNRYLSGLLAFSLIVLHFIGGAGTVYAKDEKTIVLVGASIGNGWNFPGLTDREGLKGYKLEFIPVYDSFDKSPALLQIMNRPKKPDYVIIKECSVYFPGDVDSYKGMIKDWVRLLKDKNIEPVLATSVPAGKPDSLYANIKRYIKDALGRPRKDEQLSEYNNWLRSWAKENGLKIFDIEAALRKSEGERILDKKYDRGDYTHLNKEGYRVLDKQAAELIGQL